MTGDRVVRDRSYINNDKSSMNTAFGSLVPGKDFHMDIDICGLRHFRTETYMYSVHVYQYMRDTCTLYTYKFIISYGP